MRELSKMQQKIYEYIAACIRERLPPSVREIGEAVGLEVSPPQSIFTSNGLRRQASLKRRRQGPRHHAAGIS